METGSSGCQVGSQRDTFLRERVTWSKKGALCPVYANGNGNSGLSQNQGTLELRTENGVLGVVGVGLFGRL